MLSRWVGGHLRRERLIYGVDRVRDHYNGVAHNFGVYCVILKNRMFSASHRWPTADDAVHGNKSAWEWAVEL